MIFRQSIGLLSHCSFSLKNICFKMNYKANHVYKISNNYLFVQYIYKFVHVPFTFSFCVGLPIQPLVYIPSPIFVFIYLNFSSLSSSPFFPFPSGFLWFNPHPLVSFLSKILLFNPSHFPLFYMDYISLLFFGTLSRFLWLASSTTLFSSLHLSLFL